LFKKGEKLIIVTGFPYATGTFMALADCLSPGLRLPKLVLLATPGVAQAWLQNAVTETAYFVVCA
jgi:hypothetical protein